MPMMMMILDVVAVVVVVVVDFLDDVNVKSKAGIVVGRISKLLFVVTLL